MGGVGRRVASKAGGCLWAAVDALSQGEAPAPEPWYGTIQVNGFAEASYSFNWNRPDSELNTLRVFDFDDRELKLDVAELVVQHSAANPGEIGFRIDAAVGKS